jgi:O-acetylhomoserine (thiol)-lyase
MSGEAKNDYDSDRPAGQGFSTISLHHGQTLDPEHRARAPPIYASTSFAFEDAQHGADLFALKKLGPIYTRIMNPTAHVLEYRLAKLEGSGCDLDGAHPSALATASGQSAQMIAIMTICQPGDHIIAASDLYGGTYSQFTNMFPNMGIQTSMVDGQDLDAVKAAFKDNTKAVYYETLGNPSFNVPDFDAVAAICKEKQVPLIVDNTFGMAGYTCRPIKFGANVVTSSCTKWIGGHGNTIGGIVVDGNNFDWSIKNADGTPKFPSLAAPSPSYHGMNFNDVFGPTGPFGCNMAFIFHARVCALRDMGACPNPFGSFQLLMGLETLSLRCERHSQNANALAAWLNEHADVEWVSHASLPSHSSHERAKKYFRAGCFGAVLTFGPKGGYDAAMKFINAVKLATHLANVGDAKTLVIHPAGTTHQQLSDAEQASSGVKKDMVRVSVGIEDIADIIADFQQALDATKK